MIKIENSQTIAIRIVNWRHLLYDNRKCYRCWSCHLLRLIILHVYKMNATHLEMFFMHRELFSLLHKLTVYSCIIWIWLKSTFSQQQHCHISISLAFYAVHRKVLVSFDQMNFVYILITTTLKMSENFYSFSLSWKSIMTLKSNKERIGKCKQKFNCFSSWLRLMVKGNWKAGQLFTFPSLHI